MGVRRGRPRLRRLGLALLLLSAGCGLTEEEQARYDFNRQNSLGMYDRGQYVRALHQANMALAIVDDDVPMQLVKGFCLLKLGKASRNGPMVEEALNVFEELEDSGDADDDFRVYLGLGSAHLARALQYDHEIVPVERRLESEFLSAEGRAAEARRLAAMRIRRVGHLEAAETQLREVLVGRLQKDNLFATVDLVVALNSLGGREQESIALARRALELLDETNRFTRNSLERNTRLSAAARIDLQQQLETNRDKERLLRDIIAKVARSSGDVDTFLEQIALLEEHALIGEVHYWDRAEVYEEQGRYEDAARDLEAFLRLRSRRLDYEQDEVAPEVFRRIDALRARHDDRTAR